LGNFINPISNPNRDEKTFKGINNTTFSIQSDLLDTKDSRKHQEQHLYELQQQQIQELQQHNLNKSATNKILMDIIKPIVTDIHKSSSDDDENYSSVFGSSSSSNNNNNINNKNNNSQNIHADHPQIQIIANANNHYEQMDAGGGNYPYEDSRKVIMPLALKTTLIERDRPIVTPSPLPKPQSNIEDLKKHLLMLQTYSEADNSFQSKFVVFKKPTTTEEPTTTTTMSTTTTTTQRTTTMPFPMTIGTMYRTKPSINMPNLQNSQILRDVSYPYSRAERVTIVPQVFLQNDQQQPDTEEEQKQRAIEERRKNRKNERKLKKQKQKQMKKQEQKNLMPTPSTSAPVRLMRRGKQQRNTQTIMTTSSAPYIINLNDKSPQNAEDNSRKLSRTIRSKSNRRRNQNKMQRDVFMPIDGSNAIVMMANNGTSERIDLNPKHCYDVSGMSKGQQKLCEQFTQIMPAISRGARSAIQVNISPD
jgi:hypothetical protein